MSIVADKYRGTKEYHIVFSELSIAARYRGIVTYQEIARIIGLPITGSHMGKEIGLMLGAISEDEANNGRPMLSAIAVSARGMPGSGFFALARDLGKLKGMSNQGMKRFWEEEKAAVYETWKVELRNEFPS